MNSKTDSYLVTNNNGGEIVYVGELPNKKDDPSSCASGNYNNLLKNYRGKDQVRGIDFKIMLDKFVDKIPPGGTIVDIGCGLGIEVNYFSSLGFKAYGIDISEESIRIANEKYKGLNLICGNLLDFPFSDEIKINGIFERLSLMYQYKKTINEYIIKAYNILEPGGVMEVSFEKELAGFFSTGWYLVPYGNLPKDNNGQTSSLCKMVYLSIFTEDELKQLFEVNRFKILDFACYKEPETTEREIMSVLAKKGKTNFFKSFFSQEEVSHPDVIYL